MSDELMRYVRGEARVSRPDRFVAGQAKAIHDEVRLAGFKVDGAFALAGHIMEEGVALDMRRRMLDKGDPVLRSILADFEQQAFFAAKKIQANLYNDWGL